MANITKYLEKKLLEHSIAKTPWVWASGAKTYAGLFTDASNLIDYDGSSNPAVRTGTEVNTSRLEVTWGSATANADATNSSKIVNTGDSLLWTVGSGSNWGTVTTVGIFDTSNSGTGNLLWFGSLSADADMSVVGNTLEITAGSLTLTLA